MTDGFLTLKEMIEGSGSTPRTIRYYERQGLLRAERTAGGHRLFAPSQLSRLDFIVSLREAGWSLEEITTFLSIREDAGADNDKAERLAALVAHQIARLERKLELLGRLRADLHGTRDLLPVCKACTEEQLQVDCEGCERMPPPGRLPRSFQLSWRSGEVPFDDPLAHEGVNEA